MNFNKFAFEVSLNEAPLYFIWYPNKIFRVTGTWLLNTLHRVTQMSVFLSEEEELEFRLRFNTLFEIKKIRLAREMWTKETLV